jgi:hypothetical protein
LLGRHGVDDLACVCMTWPFDPGVFCVCELSTVEHLRPLLPFVVRFLNAGTSGLGEATQIETSCQPLGQWELKETIGDFALTVIGTK